MDRGAWWATVHGVTKQLDMTEQLELSLSTYFTKQQENNGTQRNSWRCYIHYLDCGDGITDVFINVYTLNMFSSLCINHTSINMF